MKNIGLKLTRNKSGITVVFTLYARAPTPKIPRPAIITATGPGVAEDVMHRSIFLLVFAGGQNHERHEQAEILQLGCNNVDRYLTTSKKP